MGWGGLLLGLLLGLCGCTPKGKSLPTVSVTMEPQRYFAERIAGDRYQIHCVVPAGQSPESYDPTPRQRIELSESVAYLQIGYIGFERAWMPTIREQNPDLPLYDLSQGVSLIETAEEEEEHEDTDESAAEAVHEPNHDHDPDSHHDHHHHHHGGVDPHIWNSIQGARQIALNTRNAFQQIDPAHAADYESRYQTLLQEIETTRQELDRLLIPLKGTSFIIYHPALTYLAAEYGLHQHCLEMDGKEPSPAQLKRLVDLARSEQVAVVFVQPEFDQKNAEIMAEESGCRLVRINPLNADWSGEMLRIAKALSDGKAD